jgi:hypothetical protein
VAKLKLSIVKPTKEGIADLYAALTADRDVQGVEDRGELDQEEDESGTHDYHE